MLILFKISTVVFAYKHVCFLRKDSPNDLKVWETKNKQFIELRADGSAVFYFGENLPPKTYWLNA
jgi:hypothetical protein